MAEFGDRGRVPIPAGALGACDVTLQLRGADGTYREPPEVVYGLRGIYWSGLPPAGDKLFARVTYRATGYDRFTYRLPGQERLPRVVINLALQGKGTPRVPAHALQPTTTNSKESAAKKEETSAQFQARVHGILEKYPVKDCFEIQAKYLRKSILTFCLLALWERVGVRVKKLAKYFCVGTYTDKFRQASRSHK